MLRGARGPYRSVRNATGGRLIAVLGLGLLIVGCGSVGRVHADSGKRYTVSAALISIRRGPVIAEVGLVCASFPPACAQGLRVRGVDIRQVPGAHDYSYGIGTVDTPTVRLICKWDGQALTLTQPPTPVANYSEPLTFRGRPSRPTLTSVDVVALGNRLDADVLQLRAQGIYVIGNGSDAGGPYVSVAVADQQIAAYIQQRYGATLSVRGWLRPA